MIFNKSHFAYHIFPPRSSHTMYVVKRYRSLSRLLYVNDGKNTQMSDRRACLLRTSEPPWRRFAILSRSYDCHMIIEFEQGESEHEIRYQNFHCCIVKGIFWHGPFFFSSLLSISSNERVRNVYGIQQFWKYRAWDNKESKTNMPCLWSFCATTEHQIFILKKMRAECNISHCFLQGDVLCFKFYVLNFSPWGISLSLE